MPFFEKRGHARWQRDVLTDLALILGSKEKVISFLEE
jgi:hypothetical protein